MFKKKEKKEGKRRDKDREGKKKKKKKKSSKPTPYATSGSIGSLSTTYSKAKPAEEQAYGLVVCLLCTLLRAVCSFCSSDLKLVFDRHDCTNSHTWCVFRAGNGAGTTQEPGDDKITINVSIICRAEAICAYEPDEVRLMY